MKQSSFRERMLVVVVRISSTAGRVRMLGEKIVSIGEDIIAASESMEGLAEDLETERLRHMRIHYDPSDSTQPFAVPKDTQYVYSWVRGLKPTHPVIEASEAPLRDEDDDDE